MYLREEAITIQSSDYKEIDAFMKRVFPKEEKSQILQLIIMNKE